MVKNQQISEDYAVYNGDSVEVLPTLKNDSVDFIVYSPPFADLYIYSSSERDISNCATHEEFLQHYEFIVSETARIIKPGRIVAVHCQDLFTDVTKNFLHDLPNDIIRLHQKYGFQYCNRITIGKEPLRVRIRTMCRSLMHKMIVEDSTQAFTAMPDYVLIFKAKGENKVPVTHEFGLDYYAGSTPLLPNHIEKYGSFEALQNKYKDWDDPKTNKLSHTIWQRYANAIWDDIRPDNVVSFKSGRTEEDEKHLHPLQLDIIDRLVQLYTNPGEVCLTPFAGVMSEVYSPVSLGRKGIGIELKESYYKQGLENLKDVKSRFDFLKQKSLFS